MTHRAPRTVEAGQRLLERYAEVVGRIAIVEAVRSEALARANQLADTEALPLVTEQEEITKLLGPWWDQHKFALLAKGRKSLELGGCEIGSRMGGAKLGLRGDEKEVVEQLRDERWAKPYLTVKVSLNRATTLAGLAGQHKTKLRELGFLSIAGGETFFIKPVQQQGVVTAA